MDPERPTAGRPHGQVSPDHDATPPRMTRTTREARVPAKGHEGLQPVPEDPWEGNNRREDPADRLLRDQPPVE